MGKIIENPIFIIPVITRFVFIVAGLIMLKFPPNKINFLYSYRTNSSMKSQEIWQFAQKYSAREMSKLVVYLLSVVYLDLYLIMVKLKVSFLG